MGGEFTYQPKWDPIGFDPQPHLLFTFPSHDIWLNADIVSFFKQTNDHPLFPYQNYLKTCGRFHPVPRGAGAQGAAGAQGGGPAPAEAAGENTFRVNVGEGLIWVHSLRLPWKRPEGLCKLNQVFQRGHGSFHASLGEGMAQKTSTKMEPW